MDDQGIEDKELAGHSIGKEAAKIVK